MPTKTKLLLLPAVLLLGFLVSPFFAMPVHAQSGIVCIEPSSTTSCPAATVFTGQVSTQLKLAVNIQNSLGLDAFDIAVKTDPSILNPVSIDTTGYIFTGEAVFALVDCVNGVGMGCRAGVDGPGVARLTLVAFSFVSPTPTTGRLFTITYNIAGTTGGTTIGYQTGCVGTSNDSSCVSIGYAGILRPENLQTGTFINRGFSISANPTTLNIVQGDSGASNITMTSLGDFSGRITLSIVLSPTVKHPPQTSLSESMVILKLGGSVTSRFAAGSIGATTPGSYVITLTATGRSGTLSLLITLTVLAK